MRGIKTSEFWVAVGTAIAILSAKVLGEDFPVEATATSVSYILGRSATKLLSK